MSAVVDAQSVPDPNRLATGRAGVAYHALTFRDTINEIELVAFERAERRKSLYNQSPVITLSDLKDMALFLVVEPLPAPFITFFNTGKVNHWLRGVIVYMHFFIETCEELMETLDLLHGPEPVDRLPRYKEMSRDLADMRFLVGRQHSCLIMSSIGSGAGRSSDNRNNTDVLLFELLIQVGTRIVWIALSRRYLNVIDTEMNRIFRTPEFSLKFTKRLNDEASQNFLNRKTRDILHGNDLEGLDRYGNLKESQTETQRVMLQNSPVVQGFQDSEDNELLQVGMPHFHTLNDRLNFLTKCFYASEEELAWESIKIGILGQDRNDYDASLHPLDKKEDRESGAASVHDKPSTRHSTRSSFQSLTSLLEHDAAQETAQETEQETAQETEQDIKQETKHET